MSKKNGSKKTKQDFYWFKRRRYGYGWIPVTLEGWVVLLVYLTTIFLATLLLVDEPDNIITARVGLFGLIFMGSTIALVAVAGSKGPTPKWRWGKSEDDNPDEDY